jgi:hypothetical protein
VPAPDWANKPTRHHDGEWLVSGIESLRASARQQTPEPLRRRGVLIAARDLTPL